MQDNIYAVKTAAVNDACSTYGLEKLALNPFWGQKLRELAKKAPDFLFRHHMPNYGPGVVNSVQTQLQGNQLANQLHGASKYQGVLGAAGRGAVNTLKNVGHGVADMFRHTYMGSPLSFKDDIMARKSLHGSGMKALGSYAKDFYISPKKDPMSLAMTGISLGLPAMDIYHAATDENSDHRGANIGGAIAGLAAAPFTSQFGVPGAMAHAGIHSLGARAGALFDKQPAPSMREQLPNSMPAHGKNVAKSHLYNYNIDSDFSGGLGQ